LDVVWVLLRVVPAADTVTDPSPSRGSESAVDRGCESCCQYMPDGDHVGTQGPVSTGRSFGKGCASKDGQSSRSFRGRSGEARRATHRSPLGPCAPGMQWRADMGSALGVSCFANAATLTEHRGVAPESKQSVWLSALRSAAGAQLAQWTC